MDKKLNGDHDSLRRSIDVVSEKVDALKRLQHSSGRGLPAPLGALLPAFLVLAFKGKL